MKKASKRGNSFNSPRLPNVIREIKSRRLEWAGHVARIEEDRTAFKILTDKPTGERPFGRPRCRWEDNIIINFNGIGINIKNGIDLAQN